MSVVTLNLDLPAGQAPAGAKVQVWLAGTAGQPVVGYVAGKQIVGEYNVNLDTNGAGQLDLVGNDLIEPSGTVWGVRIKLPHGPNPDVFYIDVPSTGGPYDVEAVLAEAPGSLPSTALAVETAERIAADTALGVRIDDEEADRLAGDAGKQPLNANLTAIALLSTTTFGRSLLTASDALAARGAIGAQGVPTALDAPHYYVSKGSLASDSNDGLSMRSAFATAAGALTAIGGTSTNTNPAILEFGYGTFGSAASPLPTSVIKGVTGFIVRGQGPEGTTFWGPDAAPLFQCINTRLFRLKDCTYAGSLNGTGWGIEFDANLGGTATWVGGIVATQCGAERVHFGQLTKNAATPAAAAGIRWALYNGDWSNDGNNDQGVVKDCVFNGITTPLDVGHSNSLIHQIERCQFLNCGGMIKFQGGSATITDCSVAGSGQAGYIIDLQDPAGTSSFGSQTQALYRRSTTVIGLQSESSPMGWARSTAGAGVAVGGTDTIAQVTFIGGELNGGGVSGIGSKVVDWNAPNMALRFHGTRCSGRFSGAYVAAAASTIVSFVGCEIHLADFQCAGELTFLNCHSVAVFTKTVTPAVYNEMWCTGSGFTGARFQPPGEVDSSPAYGMLPARFRKAKKAFASVLSGTASAKVLCAGDATVWGRLASATGDPSDSWPHWFEKLVGGVPGVQNPPATGVADPRWVAGTGWAKTNKGWAGQSAYLAASGAAGALTYTPGVLCDTFDVYFLGTSAAGTVQASVDGGSATPVVTANGTSGWYKTTVSAASLSASHVLTLQTVTVGPVTIVGISAYDSTKTNLRVGNVGVTGSTTATWDDATALGSLNGIRAVAPDLTVIGLGVVDALNSVAVATWAANLTDIVNAAKESGDVLLLTCVPSASGTKAAFELLYQQAMANLADTLGVGWVDVWNLFGGSYTTANALGYMADSDLPNALGYAVIARAVAQALDLAAIAQPLDAELTALAGVTSAADTAPYFTGAGVASVYALTTAARSLLDDVSVTAMRTTLGLGTLATLSTITSAEITDGTIVNGDINAAAGIALSKLATDPLARANHTGTQTLATISDAGALAALSTVDSAHITDGTVALADQADVAQARIRGRKAGAGTGPPQDMTAAELIAIISGLLATSDVSGLDTALAGKASTTPWGIVRPNWMPFAATSLLSNGTANLIWYYRLVEGGTISKVRIKIGTNSGQVCVSAHSNSGSGLSAVPGTRLATSGAVTPGGTGDQDISLGGSVTLAAGDWIGIGWDNTTATALAFATAGGASSLVAGQVCTGAFPAANPPSSLTQQNGRMFAFVGVP